MNVARRLKAMARVALEGRCPDGSCARGWADIRCPDAHYALLRIANPRDGGSKATPPGHVATTVWRHDGTIDLR